MKLEVFSKCTIANTIAKKCQLGFSRVVTYVSNATVDVAELLQAEEPCSVGGVVEGEALSAQVLEAPMHIKDDD